VHAATQMAIALYVTYNLAATVTSFPAGGLSDKLGRRGPLLVTALGVVAFLLAFLAFAASNPTILLLLVAFVLAGIGIGCAETAESAVAGLLYTIASPTVAFGYLAAWMLIALATLVWGAVHPADLA
jgi:MFS family permease